MVTFIKLLDKYMGNLLCSFLSLFSKPKKEIEEFNKILVVQLWGLGETILTVPAIESLRKKFPGAKIDILATKRNSAVYSHSDISNVIVLKLNPFSLIAFIIKNFRKYDIAIDMEEYLNVSAILSFLAAKRTVGYSHGTRAKLYSIKVKYNDKQHVVQTFLDLARSLDIEYDAEKLTKLGFNKSDSNFVDKFMKDNSIKKTHFLVCVAPGAAESAKSRIWPLDRYAELCDELIEKHNALIIFIGTADEFDLINTIQEKMMQKNNNINSAGKFNLPQLFCLVGKCKLFVGNDSGPMHIAAAQGIKTIGLFGPNIPARFAPYGKGNIGVYKGHNCEFSPCINVHKGQVPDCLYPKSSNDYQKCMKNISVNDVLKEVEKVV